MARKSKPEDEYSSEEEEQMHDDIRGNEVPLSSYKGKVVLIVNVASKCIEAYQVKLVLLRDPSDDNVITVVEELRRRLPVINANQGELGGQMMLKLAKKMFLFVQNFSFRFLYFFCISWVLKEIASFVFAQASLFSGCLIMHAESPFEFGALEVFLEAICSFHAARTTELETDAYPALDELTSKIISRNLDQVRKLKSAMTRLTARVQKGVYMAVILANLLCRSHTCDLFSEA
ncbi:magnesium transporter MRS2-I [Artemisia annua]|uniref:Magnesium transporter MRS2-I n=1 Tax=Artemisia annua TaxID=35608 RepID=A0A2U1MYJ5_ARTAN|nr:magnesium transporter MRS2-I [Artemisia annua]